MASVTFYNKRKIGYINSLHFTDHQGVESDPLYLRFNSVQSVVKNHIDEKYHSFLAQPYYTADNTIEWYIDKWVDEPLCYADLSGSDKDKYTLIKEQTLKHYQDKLKKLVAEDYIILSGALKYINDEFLYCYDDKVVLIAWGMCPDTTKYESTGSWIKELLIKEEEDKVKITFDPGVNGVLENLQEKETNQLKGYKLTEENIPTVLANKGFKFKEWLPAPHQRIINNDIVFKAVYVEEKEVSKENIKVTFDPGKHGKLVGNSTVLCAKNYVLQPTDIPKVEPLFGQEFSHWSPSTEKPITSSLNFTAEYKKMINCCFNQGSHGKIYGCEKLIKPIGSKLSSTELPNVTAEDGYRFIGWSTPPSQMLDKDITFTAKYEPIPTTIKSKWPGFLKWLWRILLILLILLVLLFVLKKCSDSSTHSPLSSNKELISDDKIEQVDKIERKDGVKIDNNASPLEGPSEVKISPDYNIVPPLIDKDGEDPILIHHDGAPSVIANRLNIFFNDSNADLIQWQEDFNKAYPDSSYVVIGYDLNVRMIQIEIPENKRDQVRTEINSRIPNHEFFVIDESVISLRGSKVHSVDHPDKGWHISATGLERAWDITTGNPNVVIAIVDDGIDTQHQMFQDRFYKAYNVFNRTRSLSFGEGHEFLKNGAAGVAPNCKIMPIQVFDNGLSTFSALTSGIMYAIHNGADVINISIAPSFNGLDQLPIESQGKISQELFLNEERVYQHIINVAKKKNVILVFAAGNDNILAAILPECRSFNKTINVAAVSSNLKASGFTNYALGTNISAPGVNVNSSYPINSYQMANGTSMAAPIVAGTVALMRSIQPSLTVNQILGVLQNTGKEIDQFVPNMVQIDKALEVVSGGEISDLRNEDDNMHRGAPRNNEEQESSLEEKPRNNEEQESGLEEKSRNNEEQESSLEEKSRNNEEQKDKVTDYDLLSRMLNQLKKQRDNSNQTIQEIEEKLNNSDNDK